MMHFLDFICVKMHDFCVNAIPERCIITATTDVDDVTYEDDATIALR